MYVYMYDKSKMCCGEHPCQVVSSHTGMYVCIYVCIYVCMCLFMYVCICMYVCRT